MENDEKLRVAVDKALDDAKLPSRDIGAVALARRYATLIDDEPTRPVISDLGPKLLATLTALGLTPAGRSAPTVRGGATGDAGTRPDAATPPADALAKLRARAGARSHGTPAVDAAAS